MNGVAGGQLRCRFSQAAETATQLCPEDHKAGSGATPLFLRFAWLAKGQKKERNSPVLCVWAGIGIACADPEFILQNRAQYVKSMEPRSGQRLWIFPWLWE